MFLQRNSVGRLGYARFDQPYIVPIYFSLNADRNCVYGFSTIGEKVAAKLGAQQHEHAVIYRISIDRLTGRRADR